MTMTMTMTKRRPMSVSLDHERRMITVSLPHLRTIVVVVQRGVTILMLPLRLPGEVVEAA